MQKISIDHAHWWRRKKIWKTLFPEDVTTSNVVVLFVAWPWIDWCKSLPKVTPIDLHTQALNKVFPEVVGTSYLAAMLLTWLWLDQEDIAWQEIWRTSVNLFKVRWNDHLVNYFLLMYCYGINANILHILHFFV